MQGASIALGSGAGFRVDDASPHTVLRQKEPGQQPNRSGAHHQNFGMVIGWHCLMNVSEALSCNKFRSGWKYRRKYRSGYPPELFTSYS
jgi:hypothetical protein